MRALCSMAALALAAAATAQESAPTQLNAFEWLQAAPIVVAATSLGADGRQVEVEVIDSLRGDIASGDVLRIDLRSANRDRDTEIDRKALHLDAGESYVILLEREATEPAKPLYRITRGVRGARLLPLEGRDRTIEVLRRFVTLQDAHSEAVLWHGLESLLGETDPDFIGTALQQFLKFRRGEPDLVMSLRPLLDHPSASIRADAALLVAQIVDRHGPDVPDANALRQDLVARARRDDAIPVRVAATRALGEFGDNAATEVLGEIAASDPEQDVRYAAQMVLLERRGGQPAD